MLNFLIKSACWFLELSLRSLSRRSNTSGSYFSLNHASFWMTWVLPCIPWGTLHFDDVPSPFCSDRRPSAMFRCLAFRSETSKSYLEITEVFEVGKGCSKLWHFDFDLPFSLAISIWINYWVRYRSFLFSRERDRLVDRGCSLRGEELC